MYESLVEWVNIPFVRKPFVGRTVYGDKQFSDDVELLCYPVGKVNVIKDKQGKEVVSNTCLYVDGDVEFDARDNVVFEGVETEVLNIGTWYREGRRDIKAVYI